MTTIVFVAVLSAAALHAVWNAFAKGGHDKHLSMAAVVIGHLPIAFTILFFVPSPLPESWPYVFFGIVLHTGVTIGYDVPWPKVQGLLLSAAAATDQIEEDPAPYVLQKALDDSYVAYELNAFTRRADLRPRIYSALHANILDAFHAAGVEITSPLYRSVRDGNEPAMAPGIAPAETDST